MNELSHSALATIAAATCGVQPLPIQKSNIDFAIEFGNKNLTSDAIVAAILLHSAIESVVFSS